MFYYTLLRTVNALIALAKYIVDITSLMALRNCEMSVNACKRHKTPNLGTIYRRQHRIDIGRVWDGCLEFMSSIKEVVHPQPVSWRLSAQHNL